MKKGITLIASAILLITACNCGASSLPQKNTSVYVSAPYLHTKSKRNKNRALVTHISERTVHVSRDCTVKKSYVVLGVNKPNKALDGSGSGVIFRSKRNISYIFTAAHVVVPKKAYRLGFDCVISIRLNKDSNNKLADIPAIIVAYDLDSDVAVLSVDTNLYVSTALEINPFAGEDVWAAGYPKDFMNPLHNTISITKGTLASIYIKGRYKAQGNWHRITSQIYFGNSGGGVWSKEGKLIGIVAVLFSGPQKMPYEGFYYAKPVPEIKTLLKQKWKYWKVFGK